MRRAGVIVPLFALLLLTAATYWPVTGHQFLDYDDNLYVTDNPLVRGGLSPGGVVRAFTSRRADNWHPLTWLSHMLDVSLFGLDPGRQHLVNLAVHLLNTAVLCLVLTRATGCRWPALLAAALFALHPLHVESVAWVAERKDLLSALFFLLALAAYLRYVRRPSAAGIWSVTGLMACSLMAKPMAVTFPFLVLLLDRWPLGRRSQVVEKWPLFVLSLASSVVTIWVQSAGESVRSLVDYTLPARLANAVTAYAVYLGQTVWPAGLAVFYPHPRGDLPSGIVALSAGVLAGGTVLAMLGRRRFPELFTGWFWYLGTLVPVIGLVQVGLQARADRYTYLPLVGIFIAAAWALRRLAALRRPAGSLPIGAAAGVLMFLTVLTRRQAAHWQDTESLFRQALLVTRDNYVAHAMLGFNLYRQGRLQEALDQFARAWRLDPGNQVVWWYLDRHRDSYPVPGLPREKPP